MRSVARTHCRMHRVQRRDMDPCRMQKDRRHTLMVSVTGTMIILSVNSHWECDLDTALVAGVVALDNSQC